MCEEWDEMARVEDNAGQGLSGPGMCRGNAAAHSKNVGISIMGRTVTRGEIKPAMLPQLPDSYLAACLMLCKDTDLSNLH